MSRQIPWTPSVQSPAPVQSASAPQAPVEPQSGPAAPGAAAHSASVSQMRHVFVSQTGVAGTSWQPPVAVQSTHLFADASHLSFLPEHPESSTQSTQVAVVGSHWFSPPEPQPALAAGSQSAQRPLRAPVVAHWGVLADLAAQRAAAPDAVSQPTH